MDQLVDFHGYSFETDFHLFATEFEEIPCVYILYTHSTCLDIGSTANLKDAIETHDNTQIWIKYAQGEDIYVAFHYNDNKTDREEIVEYLREKMHPVVG